VTQIPTPFTATYDPVEGVVTGTVSLPEIALEFTAEGTWCPVRRIVLVFQRPLSPLAASSSLMHDPVRLRPASLPGTTIARRNIKRIHRTRH